MRMLVVLLALCIAVPAFAASGDSRQAPPAWMPGGQTHSSGVVEVPPPLPSYSSNATVTVNSNAAIPQTAPSGTPPPAGKKAPKTSSEGPLSGISLPWGDYLEALALICFALAILLCVLWLFKRLNSGGAFFRQSSSAMLRVENRLGLAPKKWIFVLRADDRRLIIGVTDHSINLLSETCLSDSAPVQTPLRQAGASNQESSGGQSEPKDPAGVFAKFFEKSKEEGPQ